MDPINASPVSFQGLMSQGKNTRWTREMDKYLGMVLVEQVSLGNKGYDHKLNPAAYSAAIYAVNQRFCLNLTKDHIKNRIRTWKKTYVLVKEVLDGKEFKWDNRRKLVVADNSAWKNYIKFLKGRTIENYNKMCVIIGHANPHICSDDGANLVSASAVEDDGGEVRDERFIESDDQNEKVKNIMWTEGMDKCLSDVLMEQVKVGNKVGKIFKPVAYAAAVAILNQKFDLNFSKENIKSRLKTWRKLHGIVKEVLSHDGFTWDREQKMVAADSNALSKYIKVHPDAKHLRSRSIKIYDEMCVIVGHDQISGCFPQLSSHADTIPTVDLDPHLATMINDDGFGDQLFQSITLDELASDDDNGEDLQGSSEQLE
ncbi:hypothetical protein Droror1_Dr00025114 [Drosera rotundifolia]